MPNKMLIDASHPEETRVVVVRGNRIEEFDFESQDKKQLKGNIYLARVTRVEPSLQAAFVEYGGNRHGFLAFSEIHPDYYQIPVADRQALLRAEAQEAEDEENEENAGEQRQERGKGRRGRRRGRNRNHGDETRATENAADGNTAQDVDDDEATAVDGDAAETAVLDDETNVTIAASADAEIVSEEVPDEAREPADESGDGRRVMWRDERRHRHQWGVHRQLAGHRVHRGDLQRLGHRQVREQAGESLRQHRLAGAGRADQQQVVPASGGHLQRPAGFRLADHVRQIGPPRDRADGRAVRLDKPSRFATQPGDHVDETHRGAYPHALDQGCLGQCLERHHRPA